MAALVGVKLQWENKNTFEDGVRIYRSLMPFDKNSLPEIYKELPPGTNQYIDSDVLENTTYYYMISTFVGNKEVFTPNIENVRISVAPGPIGTLTEGGVVIGYMTLDSTYGVDEGEYAIIMALAAGESGAIRWKSQTSDTPNASSLKDGLANTYACISANSNVTPVVSHPAAEYCVAYEGAGHTDWYLPSKDELNLAWINRNELSVLQLRSENYWSSSQADASNAWGQSMSNGYQSSSSKANTYRVRPVRRLKIL